MQDAGCRAAHPPGGENLPYIEIIIGEIISDRPVLSFDTLDETVERAAQLRDTKVEILIQLFV
jgi:hypothetical protein